MSECQTSNTFIVKSRRTTDLIDKLASIFLSSPSYTSHRDDFNSCIPFFKFTTVIMVLVTDEDPVTDHATVFVAGVLKRLPASSAEKPQVIAIVPTCFFQVY